MSGSPRKVFLFALPRSGSTMLCDRLTVPGRSVLLHEPMILRRMGDGRESRIVETMAKLGHQVETPPEVGPDSIAQPWFEKEIIPCFEDYDFWGIKEVYLTDAEELIQRYLPDQILLLWRDPRDVALSFLELMNQAMMSYSDRQTLKDEAWAMECLSASASQLGAIANHHPHRLLRYEQVVSSEQERQSLLSDVGMATYGVDEYAMIADRDEVRVAEVERHTSTWSDRSVNRWDHEFAGWRRTFAEICFARMQPHASHSGYPGDPTLVKIACAEPRASEIVRLQDPTYEPADGFDFAYAKRRGRTRVAERLRPSDQVMDVGGTTAALTFMTDAKVTVVDDGAPGKLVVHREWRKGILPPLGQYDVCTFVASFEYVSHPLQMISSLLEKNLKVIVTYHCTDDLPMPIRERLHFRSHLARQDWQQFASDSGATVTTHWAFDGYQSMITIEPPTLGTPS